jgi:sugar phosphate isomerase/epimerase
VLETAVELGAPLIRVWAGNSGSDTATVLHHLERACEMAGAHNIGVATEYHGGTLTQTREGCRQMLESVGSRNLQSLWQPLRRGGGLNAKISENVEDLRDLTPFLSNVHVYEWRDITAGQTKRASLRNSVQWPQYIEELRKMGGQRWLLLEYVPDDAPAKLSVEATALRALIEQAAVSL